ncbi:MAG: hypothetical protein A3H69_05940 [Candidatus Sungbacteria bacterium RIFCSPLOWO2_02_FULL_47_9]|nr:MAG: hypothetical protein A3H69_05940 [Candidatus Sungbacteria bacterium RIFCSPLOWO2_02_FULL_47_9]
MASRVRDIGYRAFDPLFYQEQGLVEGGKETLDFLQTREDELVLVTKGDDLVQKTKIEILELDRWFGDEIHIVNSKTREDFERMRQRFPEHTLISVGNSFESDIKPAIQARLYGLYIPYHTWAAEPEREPDEVNSKVFKIDRIFKIFYFVGTNELFTTPA